MKKCQNPKCNKSATSVVDAKEELGLAYEVCVDHRPWAKELLTKARSKKAKK